MLPSALDTPLALSRWTAWATAAQASGTPTIVQLNHPGRQSHPFSGTRSFFSKNIAPSALPLEFPGSCVDRLAGKIILGTPKAMTVAEIDTLVDQFTLAAKLSKAAGFKGVQIHAAHGYLLTQFLSPKALTSPLPSRIHHPTDPDRSIVAPTPSVVAPPRASRYSSVLSRPSAPLPLRSSA